MIGYKLLQIPISFSFCSRNERNAQIDQLYIFSRRPDDPPVKLWGPLEGVETPSLGSSGKQDNRRPQEHFGKPLSVNSSSLHL